MEDFYPDEQRNEIIIMTLNEYFMKGQKPLEHENSNCKWPSKHSLAIIMAMKMVALEIRDAKRERNEKNFLIKTTLKAQVMKPLN